MKASSPLLLLLGSCVSVSSRLIGQRVGGRGTAAYIVASASPSGMAQKRVAVVGAGAAGLAACRRLRDAGLSVKVLEKSGHVGGVWKYSPEGVVYKSLVTNLPKEIMAFPDHPFDPALPSFTTHADVQSYLESYATAHALLPHISLHSPVTSVTPIPRDGQALEEGRDYTKPPSPEEAPLAEDCDWHVTYTHPERGPVTETFNAVVVANGHFDVPSSPPLPGLDLYKGRVVHSRFYDSPPTGYEGKTVLCVGYKSSGTDVAREVASVAKEVHVVDRSVVPDPLDSIEQHGNLYRRPMIQAFTPDGHGVSFSDGRVLPCVDVVLLCTGYDYHAPFLCPHTLLTIGDRHVSPAYLHLFHAYWPSLSLMGLHHSVVPFPLFDLQARLIAHTLTATQHTLPSRAARFAWLEAEVAGLIAKGQGPRDLHYLGPSQWEHCRSLARAAGALDEQMDRFLTLNQQVYEDNQRHRPAYPGGPDSYRQRQYTLDYHTMTWTATNPTPTLQHGKTPEPVAP